MRKFRWMFWICCACWATGAWALSKSLLKPATMPKVFADASFEERMQVLAEGYGEVATQYDENGVCISGCAYKGMRIEDEERMVERATNELRLLMDLENARSGYSPQQIHALQQQYLQELQQRAQQDALAAGVQIETMEQAAAPAQQQAPATTQQQAPATTQQVASQQKTQSQTATQYGGATSAGTSVSQGQNSQQFVKPAPVATAQAPVEVSGGQFLFGPPVGGKLVVTSDFGRRPRPKTSKGSGSEFHKGIDVRAPKGTPLYAPADGKVVQASRSNTGGGNTVKIEHGLSASSKKVVTVYMHMDSIDVQNGQTVTKGQKIGAAGSTGNSGAPHLHYGLLFDGIQVDPLGSKVKAQVNWTTADFAALTSGTNYLGGPYCMKIGMTTYRPQPFKGNDAALRENYPQCTGWCH